MRHFKGLLSVLLALVMMLTVAPMTAFAGDGDDSEPAQQEELKNGWSEDGNYYYEDDIAVKGFKEIDGYKYYFDTADGKKVTGLKVIDSKRYYFNAEGKMLTGWHTVNGVTYYFNKPSGEALKGLKKIGNDYYYFDGNCKRVSGWRGYNSNRYYFSPDTFKAVKGLKKIGGYYYYFSNSGVMQTGWKTIKGKKYYFYKSGNKKGKAATGKVTVDDKLRRFSSKGVLEQTYNAMDKKADKLSSPTKYLILVNRKAHKVGIYKGKKGNWKRIKYISCTVGKKSTPTITGTYLLGTRQKPFHKKYFDSANCRVWYATRISGGYYFHSILYYQTSKPNKVMNPTLGKDLSHGCIRLATKEAKWIYNNIPKKTKCVIY